jgi:hypothetical protein
MMIESFFKYSWIEKSPAICRGFFAFLRAVELEQIA